MTTRQETFLAVILGLFFGVLFSSLVLSLDDRERVEDDDHPHIAMGIPSLLGMGPDAGDE